ncbi:biliverdin-producing heme oxygenase [Roseisolibacter agri]|uniref:Heme oxygenase n=1 Tax=Roseisolibacter agri TaxID=2014610 RepID=A0AA37QB34_9BACT|nr:biliverdin-producing heme oxygenase [Roseisolibacter agri]GLC26431.1 heme oxygenase [Roseisolibacter agri]
MIHALLKDGTRAQHARAEASLPVMDPALTRADYARVLHALHGFHAPLERQLAAVPWDRLGLDWDARRKTPLLARDLRALGGAPADVAVIPACDRLPDASTLARALGCAYVLEGATLGGQLVRRHLARTLGLGPDTGAAYYHAYGDDVGPMWRTFLAGLAVAVEREGCPPDELLAGARDTFDALAEWLDRTLAVPA